LSACVLLVNVRACTLLFKSEQCWACAIHPCWHEPTETA
jgi:hypothetical protein